MIGSSGSQFEISIDGKPRSYGDRKDFAVEAAEYLKCKFPNCDVVAKHLASGEVTVVAYKPDTEPSATHLWNRDKLVRLADRVGNLDAVACRHDRRVVIGRGVVACDFPADCGRAKSRPTAARSGLRTTTGCGSRPGSAAHR
jgi:hypothetical protein